MLQPERERRLRPGPYLPPLAPMHRDGERLPPFGGQVAEALHAASVRASLRCARALNYGNVSTPTNPGSPTYY